jgi:hypothetical protein
MQIDIKTIPHEDQRYETVGDWILFNQFATNLKIRISETYNDDYNFLIALHELIEAYLCKKAGISGDIVDQYDFSHPDSPEPGKEKDCPYREQHIFAEYIEHIMARYLKVDWEKYEECIHKIGDSNRGCDDNKVPLPEL